MWRPRLLQASASAKNGTENSMRSAISVAASTPCRYASLTTIALRREQDAAGNGERQTGQEQASRSEWTRIDSTDAMRLTAAGATPPTRGTPSRQ